MNTAFHVSSLEWKYSPREKSLTPTLHLAELPEFISGSSIFINTDAPSGSGNPFSNAKPFDVPDFTPYSTVQYKGTTGYLVNPWEISADGNVFGFPQTIHPGLGWRGDIKDGGGSHIDFAWFFSLSGTQVPVGDGGGLVVLLYQHPPGFPFAFGYSPGTHYESAISYVFVCDQEPFIGSPPPPPLGGAGAWPPPNFQQISSADMGWYPNGPDWGTDFVTVDMYGECFETVGEWLLVDNISFPHNNILGKAVGNASGPGILPGSFLGTNSNFGFRMGPMNPLDGPAW